MKIYTKEGDNGKTSLCCGEKASKNSIRVHAFGDLDELSSSIGFAISVTKSRKVKSILSEVQKDLFVLSSHVATRSAKMHDVLPKFPKSKIKILEKNIDEFIKKLKPLKRFVLPKGTKSATSIHIARTVCRRAERSCTAVSEKEDLYDNVLPYLNRLSDLLFVFARYENKGKEEYV